MPTFPTAFWHMKPPASVGVGTEISWVTGAWWSYGNGTVYQTNFALKQSSNFPFGVNLPAYDYVDEYYTVYDAEDYPEKQANSSYAYYGWFGHGGQDLSEQNVDLSAWHNAEPWEVGSDGLNLSVQNETDLITAYTSGYFNDDNYGQVFSDSHFNKFIQSGEATGSFTLSSTSTLTIKISGLGNDTSHYWDSDTAARIDAQEADNPGEKSIFSNSMILSLYNANTSSDTIICSGKAPMDDRLLSNTDLKDQTDLIGMDLNYNIDMQQVKLYNAGSSTIVNTTAGTKGEPRGHSDEWIDQGNRIGGGYTTSNGIGTFTQSNLAAGDYELRIKSSTYDVEYNSGAFYGFTFSFS